MKTLLIIGHTFPEPSTTAAGGRMMQLIDLFREVGYTISFASTASMSERSENLSNLNIQMHSIVLNDASFDTILKEIDPNVVLFDRFITEEQFGWRVAEMCPNAIRVLDTEDLHFLRKARQEAYKLGAPVGEANLFTEAAKRELASILRCDLSIIISEIEYKLLIETFQIPKGLLFYLPFLVSSEILKTTKTQLPTFEARQYFVALGNLKHAPNVASVRLLKQKIWPNIRKQLPKAELHVYGAYAPQHIQEMHSPKDGFLIKGWILDISEVLQHAKVQLAPIPFGAGLKGKLFDAMLNGLPTVTTTMGAEGYYTSIEIPSWVSDDLDAFAAMAVALYTQKQSWFDVQRQGFSIISTRFMKDDFVPAFLQQLTQISTAINQHRQQHFIGQVVHHHTLQATKYLSKWIEAKNDR